MSQRKEYVFISSFSVLLLLFLFNCGQQAEKKIEIPSPEVYRSWTKATEAMLNYPIPGHRDNCRVIYINTLGEAVKIGDQNGRTSYEFPEGAMIVKEIYKGLEEPEEGEEPIELTIMLKAPQHPKAKQGWLWIVKNFAAENTKIVEGSFCASCHANANEAHPYGDRNSENEFRDFVYFPPHAESGESSPVYTGEY